MAQTYFESRYVIVALVLSFLWGVLPIVHKFLLRKYDKLSIMILFALTYFICILFLVTTTHKQLVKDIAKMPIFDAFVIIVTSFITGFMANLTYYYVISKHESYIVEALISCSPLFTLVFAYFLLEENITFIGVIGVLLITLGVVCISFNEKQHLFENFMYERL